MLRLSQEASLQRSQAPVHKKAGERAERAERAQRQQVDAAVDVSESHGDLGEFFHD